LTAILLKALLKTFVFLLLSQLAVAEIHVIKEKLIPVTTYTTKNGLPSNNVQAIVEDDKGFIWLATQNGLSRFDSTQFSNFSRDKTDEYSLPNKLIEDVIVMPDGQLWMSINEVGITVFEKSTSQFKSINNTDSKLFNMPNNNLYGMSKDKSNNVWFSLYGEGIYQWMLKEQKFNKHLSTDKNAWLTSKKPFEIMVDSQNRLWVCTIDSKVYVYNINNGLSQFFNFSNKANDPLSSPIYGFAESPLGEIYAGGFAGVFKFNEQSQKFDVVVSEAVLTKNNAGKHDSVRRLMVDSKNNLWIGTTKSLLLYSNEELSKVSFYENGEIIQSKWLTHSILEGYDKNIWIGTEGMGLLKLAPDWNRYNVYISKQKELIDIHKAYQYQDKILIAHTTSGIDLLQYNNNQISLEKKIPLIHKKNAGRVSGFYQENPDELWISSIEGIEKINLLNSESRIVTNDKQQKLGSVRFIYKAQNSNFYFKLFSEKAIGYFNKENLHAQFIRGTKENSLQGNLVFQMTQGIDGNLWMATDYGIESLDTDKKKYDVVYASEKHQAVNNLYISNNIVWGIIDGSLYQFKWENEKLIRQKDTFKNILPRVSFTKIAKINGRVILLETRDSGLVELDTKTLKYKVYTTDNGLPSNVIINTFFPQNALVIVSDAGIAVENKNFSEESKLPPKIVIDYLKLGEKRMPLNNSQPLVLNYNYGALNFNAVLLSFTNTTFVEYQYKLKGLNDDWISTNGDHNYSFLNLSARHYTFQVKGRSNYGKWSKPVSYSFTVKSPPWKTPWAYASYVLAVMALFIWLMWLYRRKILYEHEITKEQAKRDLANAASKAKSDFLARVSHEVRTPLNGVLGMGELMLDTPLDEEQKIYADSIMSSGSHLLDIINDILDLSKIEAGKLELEYQEFNLLELVDEVVGSFASQAKQKKLIFVLDFNHKIHIWRIGDEIRIKQILFNLLSNAFKFTTKGEIKLIINEAKNDQVTFTVEDTGIGINKELVADLFKPFVQADSTITRKFGGTGLGLAIVKQLVDKMYGTIQVKNKTNHGSIFSATIQLPNDEKVIKNTIPAIRHNAYCLLIKHASLKNSLVEFLEILQLDYSLQVNAQTDCVFVDVLETLDEVQKAQLNKIKTNTMICFIGFDLNVLNKSDLRTHKKFRLITPPVTCQSIQNICHLNLKEINSESQITSLLDAQIAYKILLVEDNLINQQVSIEMLEKMGHEVDIVDNAEEGLVMLYRNRYDLLMLDYHLPGMDGLKLIQSWTNPQVIPVIIVTADLTDEVYQKCHMLKLDNIVAKPFTQLQLSEAIKKAFEG
jgi:signal transduction histidine kinase/ligand-binding sensor domain-containing protein/CheY-like chemotaxis protein